MEPVFRKHQPYPRDGELSDRIMDYLERQQPAGSAIESWPNSSIAFSRHPNGGLAVSSESPTIATILRSIDQSFRNRLGRSPGPRELLEALAQEPAARTVIARMAATDRVAKGIDVEEFPSPIRQDPFNALNNYPIIGYTSDGKPIRSGQPSPDAEIDWRMERKERPNEDLPWQRPVLWRDI